MPSPASTAVRAASMASASRPGSPVVQSNRWKVGAGGSRSSAWAPAEPSVDVTSRASSPPGVTVSLTRPILPDRSRSSAGSGGGATGEPGADRGGEARPTRQVAVVPDGGEPAVGGYDGRRALALHVGVLEAEQPGRLEQPGRHLHEHADGVEAVLSGEQRHRGVVVACFG